MQLTCSIAHCDRGSWARLKMTPQRSCCFLDSSYRQNCPSRTWLPYPSLPSSQKRPCSKLSAKCRKRIVCWLKGSWIWCKIVKEWWVFHIQHYWIYFHIFSISILPSLLLHIPTCQWWPALLRFTGFMEWTTQIFWTFDVVMLATQYKPPGETWLESSNHLSQDFGGHFSLAMCIKVNWYLECNRCQRSEVRHSEKNVSSCRSCHLGPYWFTTWDLEFEELSKNLLRLVVRVYCSYWQNWSCWSSYPHSRKTWFVLLGMHGLFKGLKCLSFTTMLQTPRWSSSKTGMRMALVSKNLWWPGSSFWCFRRNACCTYQHLTNCVTGCFTPRLDLVVVGPDWLLASFDEQAFIHCIFIQKY